MGPMSGLKVLDLSRVLAGPWATQMLADLGADVIKIERPEGGDDTRGWGPPYLRDAQGRETTESAYYLSANRGKRSVAIDLASPEGQKLVRDLALQSDVLVENFKVGGLARYGLAWQDLAPLNPRLIYCSISAFGQDGPLAQAAGYDAMMQAMGGIMSITGAADDEAGASPGAGPQKVGVAIVDLMAGMYAVSAVTSALYERERSGKGQHIDLALLDTVVSWLANQSMNYLVSGRAPQRQGTAHPNIVPYQVFRTADGSLMLAVGNDTQFARLCSSAGRDELARDPRFATNAERVRHRDRLVPLLDQLLRTRKTGSWVAALQPLGVPCAPINDIAQVFEEPQVKHRGLRISLPHPIAGQAPGVRNPIRYSRSALEHGAAPPLLGQHTGEVLSERLGLGPADVQALRERGIVR